MKTLACLAAFLPSVVFCGVIALPLQTFEESVSNEVEVILDFDQFDTLGGMRILEAVTLTLDATLSAHATGENMSDGENTLSLNLYDGQVQAFASWDSENAAIADMSDFEPIYVTVGPADGTTGSGPDFHDFGDVSISETGITMQTTSGLDEFIGTGILNILVDASGAFSVGGSADAVGVVDVFRTTGTVGLEYTYSTVPEPGSAALLLLCSLGGVLLRRSRAGRATSHSPARPAAL